MKKKYVKMNDMYKHLSLGNVILTIKNHAKNKTSAIQTEVFCALFNIADINETTVNNYCTGYRSIGNNYIQIYINLENKYKIDKTVFKPIVYNILNIIEGRIYKDEINNSTRLKEILLKLYNIAKNDASVRTSITDKLHSLITENNLYQAFVIILLYAVLENKQPIYENQTKTKMIELVLEDTNISTKDLQEFLMLELKEGIKFYHSIKILAEKDNPYACFKLATMEYMGEITGEPRYSKSYDLFIKAAKKNHPAANWMVANIIIKNKIGIATDEDLKFAWKYLKKAEKLGNLAAINTIGICYKEGIGVEQNLKKALIYFKKSAKGNYVYALNNLGKYYEEGKNLKEAFKFYRKSADLGESWAANKTGEMYRLGKGTKKDLKKAFEYYQKSAETSIKEICWYSKYNLAKYYYLNGCITANIEKNEEKAKKLLEEVRKHEINLEKLD